MGEHMGIHEFLGRKTLIVGDVNSGKTLYSLEILNAFLESGMSDIAVLDFAPASVSGIGGKMVPPDSPGILYLTADITAPRLTGRDEHEILNLARRNAHTIERLVNTYLDHFKDILFINDITLYLHTGDIEKILKVIGLSSTAVINAYYGSTLSNMPLSAEERICVEHLMDCLDRVIRL